MLFDVSRDSILYPLAGVPKTWIQFRLRSYGRVEKLSPVDHPTERHYWQSALYQDRYFQEDEPFLIYAEGNKGVATTKKRRKILMTQDAKRKARDGMREELIQTFRSQTHLSDYLKDPLGFECFHAHMLSVYSGEITLFWQAVCILSICRLT